MKFRINQNKKSKGMIELLLILPVFLGIIFVIGWIGFLLVEKSRIEKHAWVIQTQKTYEISDYMKGMNDQYQIKNIESLGNIENNIFGLNLSVPRSFLYYILSHPISSENLILKNKIKKVFSQFFQSSFNENFFTHTFKISADITFPGSPMCDAWLTKNNLWQESMMKAGFGYPLVMLGIPELAGIPVDLIGDFSTVTK